MASGRNYNPRQGFKKVSGASIGNLAVKVKECDQCGCQYKPAEKPRQCYECGSLSFITHDSRGEAERWAVLRMLEKRGKISNLRRQVRWPLMAARVVDGRTMAVKVGEYIPDFVYDRDGVEVIEDFKSSGVMTDVASLKLRWMEKMGFPVKLTT